MAFDLAHAGPLGLAALAVGLAVALAGLVVGVLLARGVRVPPFLPALALGVPLVLALVGCELAVERAGVASATQDVEARASTYAAAARSVAAMRVAGGVGALVAAVALLLGAAVAGAMRGPRRVLAPVAGFLVVLVIALVPPGLAVAGLAPWTTSAWSGGLYLVTGGLAALALLAGDPEKAGPEAGATGGLAWSVLVGANECLAHGLREAALVQALAAGPADPHGLYQAAARSAADQQFFGLVAVGLSVLVAYTGVAGSIWSLWRGLAAHLGLVVLAAAPLLLLLAHVDQLLLPMLTGY